MDGFALCWAVELVSYKTERIVDFASEEFGGYRNAWRQRVRKSRIDSLEFDSKNMLVASDVAPKILTFSNYNM